MGQIMAKLHTDGERTAAEVLAEVLMETLDKPDGGDADSSEAESSTGTAALPRESPRTRAGQELRELLIEVNRLTRQGKTKAANEKMDALEASAAAADAKKRHGNDLVNKRARDIRDVVFGTGQMVLTRRVVERFMEMPEVRPLLPEHLRRSSKDARTSEMLLECARDFFTELMSSKGRRSDEDANALLAAATSLLPRDLYESKRGRSAMRILGFSYRVAKKATSLRAELEDRGRGWRRVVSSKHADALDGQPIRDWWHSPEASSEDNNNKRPVRIYCGVDDETKEILYDIHWLRYQHGTNKVAAATFARSVHAQTCQQQTITEKRPTGFIPGEKTVISARCACIKKRGSGECDCDICTVVFENLDRYHRRQGEWWSSATMAATAR
jgi:hypothetical protein